VADSETTSNDSTAPGIDASADGTRNVKAACIGKLTTTAPAKFLPQLKVEPFDSLFNLVAADVVPSHCTPVPRTFAVFLRLRSDTRLLTPLRRTMNY
jgi:hypothetical protein